MGFEEARSHLEGLGVDAMKAMSPSTHRIEALLELLDHPEDSLPALHITGTNGKTSTARIAAAVLAATGLKVGTFTSPHLQSVTERITFGGVALTESEFGEVYDHIAPYVQVVEKELGEQITYFELLTGIFFLWASDAADVVVVEVGLGGRWDATNTTDGKVAVVTNIGLDHVELLGGDRETIAKEKSGIIKQHSVAITGELDPNILAIIKEQADSVGAPLAVLERDFSVLDNQIAVGGRFVSLRTSNRDYQELFLPLHGAHQAVNAAVALEAVTSMFPDQSLETDVVEEGFSSVKVPGRLEAIHANDDGPTLVLDVAHNPDGMSALVTSLIEEFAFDSVTFVVGTLEDKDHVGMLTEIARVGGDVIVTTAASVRSTDPKVLRDTAEELGLSCTVVADVAGAVESALVGSETTQLVCITGSHYVVGEARTHILGPT